MDSFEKHAYNGFTVQYSNYEMCRMRSGEDLGRQLDMHSITKNSLLPPASFIGQSCPIIFIFAFIFIFLLSRRGGESSLTVPRGWVAPGPGFSPR